MSSKKISSKPAKRVSRQEVEKVQVLIERCLQLYLNCQEAMNVLLAQEQIDPRFTKHVWKDLNKQNWEFFEAYKVRLMVKSQIIKFNELLEQHVLLMHQTSPMEGSDTAKTYMTSWNALLHPPFILMSGGHSISVAGHQNSGGYAPEHTVPTMMAQVAHQTVPPTLSSPYNMDGCISNMPSALDYGRQTALEMPAHPVVGDASFGMISTQNSNMDLMILEMDGNESGI